MVWSLIRVVCCACPCSLHKNQLSRLPNNIPFHLYSFSLSSLLSIFLLERETERQRDRESEREKQTDTHRKRDRRREERDLIFNSKLTTKVKSGHKKEGGGRGGQKKRRKQRDRVRQRNSGYKISSKYMHTLKTVSSLPDIHEKHTLIFFLYPPQYLIFMNCMHWLSFYLCVYVHLHTLKIVSSRPDIHALILSLSFCTYFVLCDVLIP